jgi:hypothetical protein
MDNESATTSLQRKSRSRLFAKLLLLAAGLLVGLLMAEAFLRLTGVSYPLPYLPDPYCGTRLQPGFSAWFTKEGKAFVRVNQAGFRDRDHARAKPAGTRRVAVLGDSYAEALQVPREQTFWHRLQQELTERAARGTNSWEVLNFGISGFSTAQELQVLRNYVWQYDPDIVLLAFYAGNDLRNNSAALEPYRVRPFFHVRDDELVLDDSFLQHPDYLRANQASTQWKVWLINQSRLLQLANQWRNRPAPRGTEQPGEQWGVEQTANFVDPEDEMWREAWRISERLVLQMHEEVEARGAQFVLLVVSHPLQAYPDTKVRNGFQQTVGAEDLFYSERRLRALGQKRGFLVISLAEPFQRYADEHASYLHGDDRRSPGVGHWNARGHALAAEIIADNLTTEEGATNRE